MISLGIAKGSTSGIEETTDSNNKAQEITNTVILSGSPGLFSRRVTALPGSQVYAVASLGPAISLA